MVSGVARRALQPRLSGLSPAFARPVATPFVARCRPQAGRTEPSPLQNSRSLWHASSGRGQPLPAFSLSIFRHTAPPFTSSAVPAGPTSTTARWFSQTGFAAQQARSKADEKSKEPVQQSPKQEAPDETAEHEFKKSDRATQAAQVNLAAKLSKEGKQQSKAGFAEIWRLIKVARPEIRWLGIAFVFLVISSSVTMSIPFSVGRILDLATKGEAEDIRLFGFTMNQFFMGLAAVLTLGAMANFGRVILLRIVGERVVARLRSQLYRRTYVQDAEFFDANRVGDLISRLSSDTVIVGKSVTQNLSDGLRALFSGGAGFAIMVWTSPKLTGLLLLMFPPIAIGAVFYGRAIRNVSRAIQKNLGTLTKIAEERLGNIKTSQAFVGEVQEVGRYNKQIRRIFALGKKESLIAATFFGFQRAGRGT
ncbi:hypothetical protein ACCO45_010748 [Purpureocillium lilacinum]|uniref:Uncharacterized protein n=1 Tax=Purpureocillium lilacinum TaxID=33203 RepID=A0ACC4DFP2_PURLI